jgi:hypothetical protein
MTPGWITDKAPWQNEWVLYEKAEGKGFEPLYAHPECAVLPLDEPPLIEWSDFITVAGRCPDLL